MPFFAGQLAGALARARMQGRAGEQERYQRGQQAQEREDLLLQRELLRAMQEREYAQRERQLQGAAEDRDLAREQAAELARERLAAAAAAAAEAERARRERDEEARRYREEEAERQRQFTSQQNALNRSNAQTLRGMTVGDAAERERQTAIRDAQRQVDQGESERRQMLRMRPDQLRQAMDPEARPSFVADSTDVEARLANARRTLADLQQPPGDDPQGRMPTQNFAMTPERREYDRVIQAIMASDLPGEEKQRRVQEATRRYQATYGSGRP